MRNDRLNLDTLRVDSFATAPPPPAPEHGEASAVTSCPKPPYCTC